MHFIEKKIIELFQQKNQNELSTTEIVKIIFKESYDAISKELEFCTDKEKIRDAKNKIAQLHRRALYHLGKLVKDKVLIISKIEGKGEKFFNMSNEDQQLAVKGKYKNIIIAPQYDFSEIEQYHSLGIVQRFKPETGITKINTAIIECNNKDLKNIYPLIKTAMTIINDGIALKNFQFLTDSYDLDLIKELIDKINKTSSEYDKKISLLIETSKIQKQKMMEQFIELFSKLNPKNLYFIIEISGKEIRKKVELVKRIIECFSRCRIKIYIKNIDIIPAPIVVGKAGIYTFNDFEWEKNEKIIEQEPLIICGQNSLLIDLERFKEYFKEKHELKTIMSACCKELLMISKLQRKNYQEYFRNLQEHVKLGKGVISLATNYIRFWNYNWKDENKELIIDILNNCKEVVQEFCYTEETIFKSCGIPLRFKVIFSSGFRKFDKTTLSERKYKKMTIRNIDDFKKKEIVDFINFREKINEIFNNCDRVRFFRSGIIDNDDVLHEITFILNSYKLGFFCFDFTERREIIKLTDYL